MNITHVVEVVVVYPPASQASREVANLTEIKNQHTPYMVSKNLSVCLSFYKRLFELSSNQNQNQFEKKFATLAARAAFVSLFFHQKQLIYDSLAGHNYLSQGGISIGFLSEALISLSHSSLNTVHCTKPRVFKTTQTCTIHCGV